MNFNINVWKELQNSTQEKARNVEKYDLLYYRDSDFSFWHLFIVSDSKLRQLKGKLAERSGRKTSGLTLPAAVMTAGSY